MSIKTTSLLFILFLASVGLAACSTTGISASASPLDAGSTGAADASASDYALETASSRQVPAARQEPAGNGSREFVTFDGTLFVASTHPETGLWQAAGWSISALAIDTDKTETPLDCTLYPHSGVAGQWVGGCRGSVSIPSQGADNIAVMLTKADGSIEMIQVAPPPSGP